MFKTIEINENELIEAPQHSLTNALYGGYIEYARLHTAKESQAVALSICLKIKNEIVLSGEKSMETKVDLEREFLIWFVNSIGEPIQFGVNKIASLLKLAGIEAKAISMDLFVEDNIERVIFDKETKTNSKTIEKAMVLKQLTKKAIRFLVQKRYSVYQNKLSTQYDIFSFFDAKTMQSYSEKSTNTEAIKWKSSLAYILANDDKSRQKAESNIISNDNDNTEYNDMQNEVEEFENDEIPF